jgi:hypothetical protein
LWVGLIVLVLFVLIYGLCYCLKLCVEAVKTGQKILTEQQENMLEDEKGLKRKRKKKEDTVLSGGQKRQNKRAEAEEEGELASAPAPYASSAATYRRTFCPEIWREVRFSLLGYPIFTDQAGQRYHEPLDFKVIRNLAESVQMYGLTASYIVAQVEALNRHCMTPSDWADLVKACLSPGQYLDWKAFLIEFTNEQAVANVAVGNPAWGRDMLLGQGRFAQQQTGYPVQVFEQVNQIAIRVWKSLPTGVDGVAELQRGNEALNQVREERSQLVWERGSVCVFPQDHQQQLWVPEQLTRAIQNKQSYEDMDVPVAGTAPASEN